MHELSYATSILNTILNYVSSMDKKVVKVSEINLEIGELTFINYEQLKFAFEVISQSTICEGAKLNAVYLKPHIMCKNCGYEGNISATDEFDIYCPKCESRSLKIVGGKEFNIKNATVIFDDENDE